MSRLRVTLLLTLLSACAPSACTQRASAPAETTPGDSKSVRFKLPLFPEGPEIDLGARAGKVVMIDVWATWCDPCVDALPAYDALAKEYAARGVEIYALSIDEDPKQISRFIESSKLELPVLHDQDAEIAERILKVQMVPTTFLLDQQGVIRFRHEGFNANTVPTLRKQIDELLAEGAK